MIPATETTQRRDIRPADRAVPREYVGRARVLCNKITAHAVAADRQSDMLIGNLRPRPGFLPVPKKSRLEMISEGWRHIQRGPSRLRSIVKFEGNKLQIAEIRLSPVEVFGGPQEASWTEDGIRLHVYQCVIAPPAPLQEQEMTLAVLGAHSIGRCFQRLAGRRTDEAVLSEVFCLVGGVIERAPDEGEVAIRTASGGLWVGARGEAGLIVRTYLQRGRR